LADADAYSEILNHKFNSLTRFLHDDFVDRQATLIEEWCFCFGKPTWELIDLGYMDFERNT